MGQAVPGGPQVYLLDDGRFAYFLDEEKTRTIVRPSLRGIDAYLQKQKPVLKIFTVDTDLSFQHRDVNVIDALAIDGPWVIDSEQKKHRRTWRNWFVYDAALVAELKALEAKRRAAEKELNDEMQKLMKRFKRVEAENWQERLAEQQSQLEATRGQEVQAKAKTKAPAKRSRRA